MFTTLDRQVFATWAQRKFRAETRSPRIAIVGTCQSVGVGYSVRLLLPQAAVDIYQVLPGTLVGIDRLASALRNYDFVFCSEFPSGFVRGGNSITLQDLVTSIVRFPVVAFAGFHPDFIGISKTAGDLRNLLGPMGPYHSAIVVFAFRAGLSVDEAEALFDRAVFEMLGYFDMWVPACAGLLAHAKATGTDLSQDLLRWTRRGCFMYTVNHPKAYVLFDIARSMLARAGLSALEVDFDDYALDPLASEFVFPVYEPIAEALGIRGSYLFKQREGLRTPNGLLLLRPFIEQSYRSYSALRPEQLASPRVSSLLDDTETVQRLRDFAAAKLRRRAAAS